MQPVINIRYYWLSQRHYIIKTYTSSCEKVEIIWQNVDVLACDLKVTQAHRGLKIPPTVKSLKIQSFVRDVIKIERNSKMGGDFERFCRGSLAENSRLKE